MFPRLWLPQLRGHILTQFARNTLLLVALPVLYLLLPQIVAIGHGYLRGSGYVSSEFEQRIFDDHWKIIALSALIAFSAADRYLLRRAKAEPFYCPSRSYFLVRGMDDHLDRPRHLQAR